MLGRMRLRDRDISKSTSLARVGGLSLPPCRLRNQCRFSGDQESEKREDIPRCDNNANESNTHANERDISLPRHDKKKENNLRIVKRKWSGHNRRHFRRRREKNTRRREMREVVKGTCGLSEREGVSKYTVMYKFTTF